MLALSIQFPTASVVPPGGDVEASVRRAMDEAASVSGAFAASPCGFRPLSDAAAAHLALPRRPARSSSTYADGAGRWVLVTCQAASEVDHQTHLRERCLTAAQRFMLSLSCDDVANVWLDETPDAEALVEAGVRLGGCHPVGLIWCG